jgi:hypothetical protein
LNILAGNAGLPLRIDFAVEYQYVRTFTCAAVIQNAVAYSQAVHNKTQTGTTASFPLFPFG